MNKKRISHSSDGRVFVAVKTRPEVSEQSVGSHVTHRGHMMKSKWGLGRGARWRNLLIAACAGVATLWTSAANATITQGDFSVFGFFETRESGRWGEGGSKSGTFRPAKYIGPFPVPGLGTGSIAI